MKTIIQSWSPEPWAIKIIVVSKHTHNLVIVDANDAIVVILEKQRKHEVLAFSELAAQNAERIVACVNWCKQ